ncbi:hypothetical protein LY78DRAFT_652371 [Colletotrichum sublineola]|nr:hypothetical protein LY78DRAFT_652371 [Colletotrichum sublineola]
MSSAILNPNVIVVTQSTTYALHLRPSFPNARHPLSLQEPASHPTVMILLRSPQQPGEPPSSSPIV